jgi:methionyl-tRNA formyltransferase
MRMEEGLDTGPVCLAEHVAIDPSETSGQLHDRLAPLGASLIVRAMAALNRGNLDATPQPADGVTYATKIAKSEARLDFAASAIEVHNKVRGLSPSPGAWFEISPGEGRPPERVKVLRTTLASGSGAAGKVLDDNLTVACGDGAIILTELQRAGKKPMSAAELQRGFPLPKGTRLSAQR